MHRLLTLRFWLWSLALLAAVATSGIVITSCAGSYQSSYPKTEVGVVEVKTLPAARVMETRAQGDYFNGSDGMFMKLFRYLQANKLAMTVPVEGDLKPGSMRFFVASDAKQDLKDSADVKLVDMPSRKVVALGGRGGYGKSAVDNLSEQLIAWLKAHPDVKPTGDAYAVFWDGPFVPAPLRRLEVHVPVE